MDFSKFYQTSLISLFSLIFLVACNSSNADSITEAAMKIRFAINTNNAEQLHSLTTLPLTIREQEWESANDGTGFALGNVKLTSIPTNSHFNKLIPPFLQSVQIEGEKPVTDITLDMFKDELGKHITNWARFKLVLFKRGEGDVEHIVLMGLNKKTNKMEAIYLN